MIRSLINQLNQIKLSKSHQSLAAVNFTMILLVTLYLHHIIYKFKTINIKNFLNKAFEDCFCCPIYGECAVNSCLNCSEGFYSNANNQSKCKECETGSYTKY